jgi:muramoyltetrapeptide carboxypeptidase
MPPSVPTRRPPPLHPGDAVAVVAPASPPRDADRYREGLDRLRDLYDVRSAWTPGKERGYLAAPDADRARALNRAIGDPDVRAILCVRGGYGCLRLLDRVDYPAARRRPTLLVGYSDVTALHLALHRHAGWAGLSGPVVTEWPVADTATLDGFRAAAEGRARTDLLGGEARLVGGSLDAPVSGPLLGGNLSVLSRVVGTPYCPSLEGALLVLEDVGEAPYRIDRMLAHLRLAGAFAEAAAVVLGDFSDCTPGDAPSLSLDTVFEDYFGAGVPPTVAGLDYGHRLPRRTLPIGVSATLAPGAEGPQLTLDQQAVAPEEE